MARILALLAKYDIKGTFFIPGMVIGTYPQVCEKIVAAGHEVGHHGWTHVPPANMTPDQEEAGPDPRQRGDPPHLAAKIRAAIARRPGTSVPPPRSC